MANRRSNPLSEENIKRIDRDAGPENSATHGFQVYIQRQGTVHTRFFADRLHGGRNKARDAARFYRDQLKATLPPPTSPIARDYQAKSNTGVRGLTFRERRNKDGSVAQYVQVHTRPEKGKVVNIHLRYTNATKKDILAKAIAIRDESTAKRLVADEAHARAQQRAAKQIVAQAKRDGLIPVKAPKPVAAKSPAKPALPRDAKPKPALKPTAKVAPAPKSKAPAQPAPKAKTAKPVPALAASAAKGRPAPKITKASKPAAAKPTKVAVVAAKAKPAPAKSKGASPVSAKAKAKATPAKAAPAKTVPVKATPAKAAAAKAAPAKPAPGNAKSATKVAPAKPKATPAVKPATTAKNASAAPAKAAQKPSRAPKDVAPADKGKSAKPAPKKGKKG